MMITAAIDLGPAHTGIAIFDHGQILTTYIGSEMSEPHKRVDAIVAAVKGCDIVNLEVFQIRDLKDPEGAAAYYQVQHYVQRDLRSLNIAYLNHPERSWRRIFVDRATSFQISGVKENLQVLAFLNNFKNEHVKDAVHLLFSQLTPAQLTRLVESCK